MYKIIIGLIICVCFYHFTNQSTIDNEEIRIRVLSNSNEENDLEYKHHVKEYLLEIIDGEVFDSYNIEEIDNYFKENSDNINELISNKFNNVKVSYTWNTFESKTYNDTMLRPKRCKTLLVEIGEAKGDNWFTSIYLENKLGTEDKVVFKSYILELIEG